MAKEVRASHILVESERKARDIIDKIKSGKKFEDMAKKHSSCPSKSKGGDLGYFKKGQMAAEFEKAAFNAKKGDLVGPVKTKYGYHVIKIADMR